MRIGLRLHKKEIRFLLEPNPRTASRLLAWPLLQKPKQTIKDVVKAEAMVKDAEEVVAKEALKIYPAPLLQEGLKLRWNPSCPTHLDPIQTTRRPGLKGVVLSDLQSPLRKIEPGVQPAAP